MSSFAQYQQLLADIREVVAYHQLLGIDRYPVTPFARGRRQQPVAAVAKRPPQPPVAARPKQAPTTAEPAVSLAALAAAETPCKGCRLPGADAASRIFGEGNPQPQLLVISEWPTAADVARGAPFSGAARELLERMLAAIKLDMTQVYLTNVVKCKPAGDQPPAGNEADQCRRLLGQQIDALAPAVILVTGSFAARLVLQTGKSIFHLRGRRHQWRGTPLYATYHPGFLLEQPEMKKAAWYDLQLVRQELDRALRKKG